MDELIRFAMVVAMDKKQGIGKDGKLPWHLPADLKHFKEITTTTDLPSQKNVVMMGRKTWESLPENFRPLPGRINLVLSSAEPQLPKEVLSAKNLTAGLTLAHDQKNIEKIFVIGGAQVFKEAIGHEGCEKLYVTNLLDTFNCDTFFPAIPQRFEQKSSSAIFEENSIRYFFTEFWAKDLISRASAN